jgi:hypothetical protein
MFAAGLEILLGKASYGSNLIKAAFTRTLPQRPLYCHAEHHEDAYPETYENCFNHDNHKQIATVMPSIVARRERAEHGKSMKTCLEMAEFSLKIRHRPLSGTRQKTRQLRCQLD